MEFTTTQRGAWQAVKHEAPPLPIGCKNSLPILRRNVAGGKLPSSPVECLRVALYAQTIIYVEGWHSQLKKVVGKAHPNSLSRRIDTNSFFVGKMRVGEMSPNI